jgi:hypothetical protein
LWTMTAIGATHVPALLVDDYPVGPYTCGISSQDMWIFESWEKYAMVNRL